MTRQPIVGYCRDTEGDWVAKLRCGHQQHVRHKPPWTVRPWVASAAGRESMLGFTLACPQCERGEPCPDDQQ